MSDTRRFAARVVTPEGVWVYWNADGHDDTAKVRNISLGGLFIETSTSQNVASTVKVDFLVQEGQITADTVVRRAEPGCGLALKFTAVPDLDKLRLGALVDRLRETREATST